MRIYGESWEAGGLHGWPFLLEKRGDFLPLHAHLHGHVSHMSKPGLYYIVKPNGLEVVEQISAFGRRYIEAGEDHILVALEDMTHGECIFPIYGPDGRRAIIKERSERKPFAEECIREHLPDVLRRALEAA